MSQETNAVRQPAEPSYYVGLGASAGGLEALENLIKSLPQKTGMAFVIIQHLSPDYKSLMAEILSKKTRIPVYQAREGMQVETDTIYLIPPKMDMKIFNDRLTLSEHTQPHRGISYPIDLFFQSLAQDQGRKAVGIILSGTGSDGTRGLRAIKEAAGLTMVQDPETAAFDGMPRSAIDSGLADFVLAPETMPEQLLSYANHPIKADIKHQILLQNEDALTRLFLALRERHGVDFSQYKPATILRRIERRITINQVENIDEYLRFVTRYPSEVDMLYKELLIGVTNFFRDTEAFQNLSTQFLQPLLEHYAEDQEIRFWCAGCSTGEEAYSMAIVLLEALQALEQKKEVKIFATDVDKEAIIRASAGEYPQSIAADIPRELLDKYFVPSDQGYRVVRQLREMIVFAQHNLLRDPPFTKIHLVSCRNLLIYLQPLHQKKVVELFNFSLVPEGLLFLGSSETVGEAEGMFSTLDNKWKILRSRGIKRAANNSERNSTLFDMSQGLTATTAKSGGHAGMRDYMYDRLLERFLNTLAEHYVPFAMLVNSASELLHIVGDSRRFLHLPPGKLQMDVSKLLIKELMIPVATGIQKVLRDGKPLSYTNIRISGDSEDATLVRMKICPVPHRAGMDPLVAVFIEDENRSQETPQTSDYDVSKVSEQRIYDLEHELQFTQENLQATVEELETSNEELQATNEELLASNEELQSTNEELQSVNEELYSVNAEYQNKITELTEANNDLDNLISIVHMPTVYLDENLEVRRTTPEAKQIFRVIDQDIGRPLSHLAHDLVDVDLETMVTSCQKHERHCSQRVRDKQGREYLLRIIPYRIAPQAFAGIVLTFFDLALLAEDSSYGWCHAEKK